MAVTDLIHLQNLPLIEDQPEFIALIDDEPSRRLAFDKFIKRQKVRFVSFCYHSPGNRTDL